MKKLFLAVLAICLLVGGCISLKHERIPLVVGSFRTVGIAAKGNPETQQVEVDFGYSGGDIAIVPQAIITEDDASQIVSKTTTYDKDGNIVMVKTNAVSVFSNFGMDASAGANTEAIVKTGMKNFLALGNAADELAAGFRESMAKPTGTNPVRDFMNNRAGE